MLRDFDGNVALVVATDIDLNLFQPSLSITLYKIELNNHFSCVF